MQRMEFSFEKNGCPTLFPPLFRPNSELTFLTMPKLTFFSPIYWSEPPSWLAGAGAGPKWNGFTTLLATPLSAKFRTNILTFPKLTYSPPLYRPNSELTSSPCPSWHTRHPAVWPDPSFCRWFSAYHSRSSDQCLRFCNIKHNLLKNKQHLSQVFRLNEGLTFYEYTYIRQSVFFET